MTALDDAIAAHGSIRCAVADWVRVLAGRTVHLTTTWGPLALVSSREGLAAVVEAGGVALSPLELTALLVASRRGAPADVLGQIAAVKRLDPGAHVVEIQRPYRKGQ